MLLMPYATLLQQSPCTRSSPLLTHTSTEDTQTQFFLSLCGVSGSWCAQGLFEPSECLWWVRGLILNTISPLSPSCWGFSFALGRGYLFLVGSNILQLTVVQQQVVVLEFSQEKMSAHPVFRHCIPPIRSRSLLYPGWREMAEKG